MQSIVYSAADVFVIPSLQESFGQTALEAMACGTPVVWFETTGITDVITDGKTGLFAKLGDAKDLEAKLTQMLEDDAARLEMGRHARIFAAENFTYEKQGAKYAELYSKVLNK